MSRAGLVAFLVVLSASQIAVAQEVQRYPISGLLFSAGGFNYVTAGVGYAVGEYSVAAGHFAATVYGVGVEYKSEHEIHVRPFARLYGGSGGALIGISTPIAWDFDSLTVGLGPEIGVGFWSINLIYRYNLYLTGALNCHEIVLNYVPVHDVAK